MNISEWIYKRLGWSLEVSIPDYPKYIICIAPHTSNWDFIYAQLVCKTLRWKASFLMKKTWFFFPLNYIFKAMGGIPVSQKGSTDLTETIINLYNNSDRLLLAMTPEGTRKRVEKWRSGIIYIAKGANVPIAMAAIDYKKKLITLKDIYIPTGDVEKDMQYIKQYYKGVHAKYPDKFCID